MKSAKRIINKVAVLGSGVMGSQIALHFAGCGYKVLLLDIAAKPSPEETLQGIEYKSPEQRNRIVNSALASALKLSPNPVYHTSFVQRITTGNFTDNLPEIKDADWVLEVVTENLEIKRGLFAQVDSLRRPGSIISSNTSGIPIHLMAEGRSEDFNRNFCGTHFFNPPRYLKLLEIIPGPATDHELIAFLLHFGDRQLGKVTVEAKDTPGFIANRIGVFSIMETLQLMQELNLSIDDVDKLTGPVIGHPKSATFRTSDVVGLDTLAKVTDNFLQSLDSDERKDVFKRPEYLQKMLDAGRTGEKKGQGFYRKVNGPDGSRQILSLNLQTLEYGPGKAQKFATLEQTKTIERLADRFKVLLAGKDSAGEFYRKMFAGLFSYASQRIPEIADSVYKIDGAISAGFGWDIGIFETWDAIGLEQGIRLAESENRKPAEWVYEMQAAGAKSFYKTDGGKKFLYDINSKTYLPLPGQDGIVILDNYRSQFKVWGNSGASLFDIGDGILNLEFHSKMNTMGGEVIAGINKAIEIAEKQYSGLVIGNEGVNFSAGANLALVLMFAAEQEFDELDLMIRQFQQTMMRVRYSSVPVVVAPHGLSLGGGCEITLHADAVQAGAETYIGLVETGVGLIPSGGGTKETAARLSDAWHPGDAEYNLLQTAFMNIAMAKVSTSAYEAFDMNILRRGDGVTVGSNRLISDAKQKAIELAASGYSHPVLRNNIRVPGRAGLALLKVGIYGMRNGNYISDHDMLIANKLAYILCGGDLSRPQEVSEQYLLDLERDAFLSLCGERKTLERIQHTLNTGKPLRN
ncbi:MAG: 3-hydroxyacyl-CoA dehydrogenase/enoyl-CoA hydratase family protein [Bacteroidota bacterium]